MTQPAYPPGPYGLTDHGPVQIWAPGRPVLATLDMRFVSINEYKAMGHLFAAAPDMLAALRRLRGFAANYAHQSAIDAASGLFDAVDAAISKAEGRT